MDLWRTLFDPASWDWGDVPTWIAAAAIVPAGLAVQATLRQERRRQAAEITIYRMRGKVLWEVHLINGSRQMI